MRFSKLYQQLKRRPEKKGSKRDLNQWPLWFRCKCSTTELWSHWELVNCEFYLSSSSDEMAMKNIWNKSDMWIAVERTKKNEIFTVIFQLKQLKRRPEKKNSDSNTNSPKEERVKKRTHNKMPFLSHDKLHIWKENESTKCFDSDPKVNSISPIKLSTGFCNHSQFYLIFLYQIIA